MERDFVILAYFFKSSRAVRITIRHCCFDELIYRLYTLGVCEYVILTVDGKLYPDCSKYSVPDLSREAL